MGARFLTVAWRWKHRKKKTRMNPVVLDLNWG